MKKKIFKCEKCSGEVSDSQKFCNHCGSALQDGCKTRRKKKLQDEEELLGESPEDGDEFFDPSDVFIELTNEYADEVDAFFGTESDFLGMVEDLTGEGMSEAEAVDALLQMFFEFVEDPEAFLADLEMTDSVSTNKKARYVIDQLTKAGLSQGKAVALIAYHGSLKSIKSMKDAKGLLKYKYLKDMITEKEAQAVISYFTGKKSPSASVAGLGDSSKVVFKCEKCSGVVMDNQKFCNHCGSQLVDEVAKAFKVTYTKKVGGDGTVVVKAQDAKQALKNAAYAVGTGNDFRDPVEVPLSEYTKPNKQGFKGSERA